MYRNAEIAFQDLLRRILRIGETVTVRDQEVMELRAQTVQVANPLERVYILPHRNQNIFASIAEAIWVMAGRNDVEYLLRYLPRAVDFSDDGKIWRGGYGPRLRNWYGVDQFQEVANILNREPSSRRAVMNIFDPGTDFAFSKDIPCNNWLHFMIRGNRLHMFATLRSNDIMWGFSGINTFEWSVLHEMMAYWTHCVVGEFTMFISSLHLYSRHYDRARRIVSSAKLKSLYDFSFRASPFETPLAKLRDTLSNWFDLEESLRGPEAGVTMRLKYINDPFLRDCAQMLHLYNLHIAGAQQDEVAHYLTAMPPSDLKIGAIEYFGRNPEYRTSIKLSLEEQAFFNQIWQAPEPSKAEISQPHTIGSIFQLLSQLHYKKTLVYKDSWKKHGEVVGVFANIARKYDRIESIIVDQARVTTDETLIDTLADLAVYAVKYLTYLAEHYEPLFQNFVAPYHPSASMGIFRDNLKGFDAVTEVLGERNAREKHLDSLVDMPSAFQAIQTNYRALEDLLINNDWRASDMQKCNTAANISIAAVQCLIFLSITDPLTFRRFVSTINEM